MRRLVSGLVAGLMLFFCLGAKVHTDKTFLAPRSHNENLAMEYTGWHKQFRKKNVNKWDGAVQVTGFYQASTNKEDLGKYFGKYNSATGPNITNPYADDIQDFIWVTDREALDDTVATLNNELALLLDSRHIIHDYDQNDLNVFVPDGETLDVKGTFRPKQTSYGVVFDWHQKLDKLTKGLYFKVSVPVVHVKNDLNVCYTGDRLTQRIPTAENTPSGDDKVSLANYLGGCYSLTNSQDALTHAKICGSDSKTGVADVKVKLGYNFMYHEHKHFGVNACLTIPTNGTPNGEKLFEATLGYLGHWAIGMGVDCAFELWQHGKKSLEFVGAVDYNYVLNATEKRTLGIKYADELLTGNPDGAFEASLAGKRIPMGYYMLGAQAGKKLKFPLANVLTRDVGVEPGSRIEVLADLAFNWCNFTFDLGYNLFAKEKESVTVKCWQNDLYAIAGLEWDPDTEFTAPYSFPDLNIGDGSGISGAAEDAARWIQRDHLLAGDAATPVYVTHKLFAGFTYAWDWKYPLMFGCGGSWEFAQGSNSTLDGYALWAKLGVTF